jgi:O-acetylserine/cysteine efflux transporter
MQYTWLLFTLYAAIAYGVSRLVYRLVMKREEPYSFSLLLFISGFIFSLPFALLEFSLPTGSTPWLYVVLSTLLWAAILWIANISFKHTPVSVREPIAQTQMVFLLLFAVVLLGESLNLYKLLGVGLILAGMLLVTIHGRFVKASLMHYGVRMTMLTALLTALVAIVDKKAMQYFQPAVFNSLLYLLPALVLLLFIRKRKAVTMRMVRLRWKVLLLAGFLSSTMYLSILKAYQLAEASVVYPLTLLGSLIVVFGGMLVFREERVHLLRKTLAALLITLGAVLIAGAAIL